jgi:carbon-monoxide dehydrogenase small subunit
MKTISLTVNGKQHTSAVEERTSIADFLREELLLTGTHLGCEQGVCGACTVNINGAPARSCTSFAVAYEGAEIWTIEGFDTDPLMSDLRQAFTSEHALQCGFCTPGLLVTARDIVTRLPEADEERIRIELSGNLCRCTGYVGIVNAIRAVMDKRLIEGSAFQPNEMPTAKNISGPTESKPFEGDKNAPEQGKKDSTRSNAASGGKITKLTQTFSVKHPRLDVWDMFQNIERVVKCLPGASVTGPPVDGHIKGAITIKLGPIRANFSGEADIAADTTTFTGNISGYGLDSGHSSRARGEVTYVLSESDSGSATQVDVEVAFALSGTLAQFSRGGIVKSVADKLTQTFAANLESDMSGGDNTKPSQSPDELDMGNLVFSVIWSQIKSIFSFLYRKP